MSENFSGAFTNEWKSNGGTSGLVFPRMRFRSDEKLMAGQMATISS